MDIEELNRVCNDARRFLEATGVLDEGEVEQVLALVAQVPIDQGVALNRMLLLTPSLFSTYAYWRAHLGRVVKERSRELRVTWAAAYESVKAQKYAKHTETEVKESVRQIPAIQQLEARKEEAEVCLDYIDLLEKALTARLRMLEQVSNNERRDRRVNNEGE